MTKGIWVWCVPHPDKANTCLALLDTEGLGDVEKVYCKIFLPYNKKCIVCNLEE